jgi:hypothetical protein
MKRLMVLAMAACAWAQGPDGKDVDTAIPIFFGQTVNDIVDRTAARVRVYKINLARGQRFIVAGRTDRTDGSCCWEIGIYGPTLRTIASINTANRIFESSNQVLARAIEATYQVPAAGTHYVAVFADAPGINYTLRVTAEGTPLAVPNPTTAGCLTGKVDSILYSLQLIAAGLPDEVTIGGQRACAACVVKPPLYPELVTRLEAALKSGVNVEACHDSTGSIFQLKLMRP